MSIAKQLYQLQEVDLEIESREKTRQQLLSQLGESQMVINARARLASEQQRLEEQQRQQRSVEWEIEDLTTKLKAAEETLYSGRVRNPKELTNLQHESNAFQTRRRQLEDNALVIMEQVELLTASVAAMSGELKQLESEWHNQQQQLSKEIEQVEAVLAKLKHEQQLLLASVTPQVIDSYHQLRKQKGVAVARVAQGICSGCRISLPTTELQRARGGNLAQCSSCGRILYLA